MSKIFAIAVVLATFAAKDGYAAEDVIDIGAKKQFWFNSQGVVAETSSADL